MNGATEEAGDGFEARATAYVRGHRDSGYTVVLSETSDEALTVLHEDSDGFDLLLTDVVMPGMSGQELAERATEVQPGIRCLLMTGYAEEMPHQHGDRVAGLLQKPFTSTELLAAVARTLRS